MAEDWYYAVNGQAYGPVPFAELQQLVASGQLGREDQISSDNVTWTPADFNAQLAPSFANARAAHQAGSQTLSYPAPGLINPSVSENAVQLLKRCGFWVRIMSVLMWISVGLMFMLSGVMALMAASGRVTANGPPPMMLALLYIVMAAFYIAPAVYLSRFATQAKAFAMQREQRNFEAALGAQKSFWKFCAILTLVVMGCYALAIPIIAVAVVMRSRP